MKVERELKEIVKRAIEKVKRVHYQNYFAYAYDKKQLTRLEEKRSTKHIDLQNLVPYKNRSDLNNIIMTNKTINE